MSEPSLEMEIGREDDGGNETDDTEDLGPEEYEDFPDGEILPDSAFLEDFDYENDYRGSDDVDVAAILEDNPEKLAIVDDYLAGEFKQTVEKISQLPLLKLAKSEKSTA